MYIIIKQESKSIVKKNEAVNGWFSVQLNFSDKNVFLIDIHVGFLFLKAQQTPPHL